MTARNLTVTARALPDGKPFTAKGRAAETLLLLLEAGPRGISALEAFEAAFAVRLAAYVHRLRELGLHIETTREPFPGGFFGRYTLATQVTVISRSDEERAVA